jgi:hypothetical protein
VSEQLVHPRKFDHPDLGGKSRDPPSVLHHQTNPKKRIHRRRTQQHHFHRLTPRRLSPTTSVHSPAHPFRPQTDVAAADAMSEVQLTDLSRLLHSKRNESK